MKTIVYSILSILGAAVVASASDRISVGTPRFEIGATSLLGVLIYRHDDGPEKRITECSALVLTRVDEEAVDAQGRRVPAVAFSTTPGFSEVEGRDGVRLRVSSDLILYYDSASDSFQILGAGFGVREYVGDRKALQERVENLWKE